MPKWIKEFNKEKNISEVDPIDYHFHLFRENFPLFEINDKIKTNPMLLLYIISENAFHYDADINNQVASLKYKLEIVFIFY